jgi:hypothetical protein
VIVYKALCKLWKGIEVLSSTSSARAADIGLEICRVVCKHDAFMS